MSSNQKNPGELSDQQLDDVSGGQEILKMEKIVVTAKRSDANPQQVVKMDKVVVTARREDDGARGSRRRADRAGRHQQEVSAGPQAPCRASIAGRPGAAASSSKVPDCTIRPVEHHDAVGVRTVFRRCAITMRVASSPSSDSSTVACATLSSALVASSSSRMRGLRRERAREHHALALPARDRRKSLAHQRVEAHRHRLDVGGDARQARRFPRRGSTSRLAAPTMLV